MNLYTSTLEITTKIGCPVNCTYCPQDKTTKNYRGGDRMMSVDTLKKCLEKLPKDLNNFGVRYPRIEFSGFGEPYANPDCTEMINLVHDMGFRDTTLYTTFKGMTVADFEKIRHIPFYFTSVHLPDVDGMTNIQIHDEYYELLGLFIDTPNFNVSFFAHGNMNPEVMEFIVKKHPDAFTGKYVWGTHVHSRAGNLDEVETVPKLSGHIKCSNCENMELNHNILLPNGDVSVCCMDFGLKHIVGNLLEDEYLDLFTSEEHNKVVAGMYVEEMNSLCRICDYGKVVE